MCRRGAMDIVKAGLMNQRDDIRRLSLVLMKNVAEYDEQIQAFNILVHGITEIHHSDEELSMDQIEKTVLPPIKAITFATQNEETALILLIIGASEALLNLLKFKNIKVQESALIALSSLGHTSIHANQIALAGGLEAILKCQLAGDKTELVQALANGFTKLLLKTTHIPSIAKCLTFCRYKSGKKAICEHLIGLLGCANAKLFKTEIVFLQKSTTNPNTDYKPFVKHIIEKIVNEN